MRYDKIHSATSLKLPDGTYKFRIARNVNSLIDELDNAVYDDFTVGAIAKGCLDHAIDSYGLFLVFYSSDISPISVEEIIGDTRTKWQKKLDEEEEDLDNGEIDSWGVKVEEDFF